MAPVGVVEVLCVQAKCYSGFVRTATIDRLRGAVERYAADEAQQRVHVKGVLVTDRDQVDEAAQRELARHGFLHCVVPAPPWLRAVPNDRARGRQYERFLARQYRQSGYKVEERGRHKRFDDDGLDLICVRALSRSAVR